MQTRPVLARRHGIGRTRVGRANYKRAAGASENATRRYRWKEVRKEARKGALKAKKDENCFGRCGFSADGRDGDGSLSVCLLLLSVRPFALPFHTHIFIHVAGRQAGRRAGAGSTRTHCVARWIGVSPSLPWPDLRPFRLPSFGRTRMQTTRPSGLSQPFISSRVNSLNGK